MISQSDCVCACVCESQKLKTAECKVCDYEQPECFGVYVNASLCPKLLMSYHSLLHYIIHTEHSPTLAQSRGSRPCRATRGARRSRIFHTQTSTHAHITHITHNKTQRPSHYRTCALVIDTYTCASVQRVQHMSEYRSIQRATTPSAGAPLSPM